MSRDRWLLLCCLVVQLIFLVACQDRQTAVEVDAGTTDQQRLARSLGIIRTATAERPQVLKLLFYGQSISSPRWTDDAVARLRATYPYVRFVVRNMAIGGFSAKLLERAAARDLAEFYPDLIVFHVYGDHRAYERIIRLMRARTAAEIVIQSDHVVEPIEPPCPARLRLSWRLPAGCDGSIWLRQRNWSDFMSAQFEPELTRRYGLAFDPRRWAWNAYLRRHRLAPTALLNDGLHPNAAGWRLMARLFGRYFDRRIADWRGEGQSLVRDERLPGGTIAEIGFTGNRVELIADTPLDGKVAALVDGKSPQEHDGCWQTSRASTLPNVSDWPAIRQVTIDPALHRSERWTATLTGFDAGQSNFNFRLVGSVGGPDGTGEAQADFTSRSGRVRIAARDWVVPEARAKSGVDAPEGLAVTWDRHFVCRDEPAVPLTRGAAEVRHVVATGLPNGPHRLRLRFAPGARALVRAVRVYRPPLVEGEGAD